MQNLTLSKAIVLRIDPDPNIRTTIRKVLEGAGFRHIKEGAGLKDIILPGLAYGSPDEATKKALGRLLYVSEDIVRRMVDTKFDHVSKLCQSLIEDTDLLKPLSTAILRGFDEKDADTARLAHKISESVQSKT
ncbi:MAG: hypothetical protein JKY92_05130 [Magnetovibrio sp.]|nr:hypothetical protein [Magnetovibrio sp.]